MLSHRSLQAETLAESSGESNRPLRFLPEAGGQCERSPDATEVQHLEHSATGRAEHDHHPGAGGRRRWLEPVSGQAGAPGPRASHSWPFRGGAESLDLGISPPEGGPPDTTPAPPPEQCARYLTFLRHVEPFIPKRPRRAVTKCSRTKISAWVASTTAGDQSGTDPPGGWRLPAPGARPVGRTRPGWKLRSGGWRVSRSVRPGLPHAGHAADPSTTSGFIRLAIQQARRSTTIIRCWLWKNYGGGSQRLQIKSRSFSAGYQ